MRSEAGSRRRLAKFGLWIALAVLGLAVLPLAPLWVRVWWTGLASPTRRTLAVGFLDACLIAHGTVLAGATLGALVAGRRLVMGRRLGVRRPVSARVLLLCVACLLGAGMLEAGAWGLEVWSRQPPPPPLVPEVHSPLAAARVGVRSDPDSLTLLVVGESTAEGQPFNRWFSIGQAVAWQLEQAKPGRKVRVVMHATGGVPLSHPIRMLGEQTECPDLVLLCSGHNEFQARWGWSRVVNYYADDAQERPRNGLVDHVGGITPFARLIRLGVERQEVSAPPAPRGDRELVDRPVCEPSTRDDLRTRFAFELERVVDWCERCGAVPILVIPAGNDVGFDPDRSVLDPSTRLAAREAFGSEFLAVRASEEADPEAAIASYRALLARQPLFAEAHYRLARLLLAEGDTQAARREFASARDRDGLPMRCPSEFQEAYRAVARAHPGVVLVDSPAVLTEASPTKLLDDHMFHDGQHPSFRAYVALAQDALDTMRSRNLFGLGDAPPTTIDPTACAAQFGLLDSSRWAEVCRRSATFWVRLATGRYDPEHRVEQADRLTRAAEAIEQGTPPEEAGVPGLGVRPEGFP